MSHRLHLGHGISWTRLGWMEPRPTFRWSEHPGSRKAPFGSSPTRWKIRTASISIDKPRPHPSCEDNRGVVHKPNCGWADRTNAVTRSQPGVLQLCPSFDLLCSARVVKTSRTKGRSRGTRESPKEGSSTTLSGWFVSEATVLLAVREISKSSTDESFIMCTETTSCFMNFIPSGPGRISPPTPKGKPV